MCHWLLTYLCGATIVAWCTTNYFTCLCRAIIIISVPPPTSPTYVEVSPIAPTCAGLLLPLCMPPHTTYACVSLPLSLSVPPPTTPAYAEVPPTTPTYVGLLLLLYMPPPIAPICMGLLLSLCVPLPIHLPVCAFNYCFVYHHLRHLTMQKYTHHTYLCGPTILTLRATTRHTCMCRPAATAPTCAGLSLLLSVPPATTHHSNL